MNIIPNASPNHHTASTHANDTRIAGFVVRLYRIPNPIATWISAAPVLKIA